jgi:hypothetical protein
MSSPSKTKPIDIPQKENNSIEVCGFSTRFETIFVLCNRMFNISKISLKQRSPTREHSEPLPTIVDHSTIEAKFAREREQATTYIGCFCFHFFSIQENIFQFPFCFFGCAYYKLLIFKILFTHFNTFYSSTATTSQHSRSGSSMKTTFSGKKILGFFKKRYTSVVFILF